MLSSVFYNANTLLYRIFYSNISESQRIATAKQIFQLYLHAVYLLALVLKRANICNWEHLDLQILYNFFDLIQKKKKKSYTALICFHYFRILVVQSKHKNIKKKKQQQQQRDVFKLFCYFKLTKEVKITGVSMAWFNLVWADHIKFKLALAEQWSHD